MSRWTEDWPEFEDVPNEIDVELDKLETEPDEVDLEIPDVWWAEDLQSIEDHDLQEKEIQAAQKLMEEGAEFDARLDTKVESGQIEPATAEVEYLCEMMPKERKAATRAGLATEGLTYDHLGDISEDQDLLATGNPDLLDRKAAMVKRVRELGPDQAQEVADKLEEDGQILDTSRESISRQVKLSQIDRK